MRGERIWQERIRSDYIGKVKGISVKNDPFPSFSAHKLGGNRYVVFFFKLAESVWIWEFTRELKYGQGSGTSSFP